MIITVTANAAVDKTLTVPNFQTGLKHRARESVTLPGGKGVNIARALKALGQPVVATGLVGGRAGQQIVEGLQRENVLNDFVHIGGESRTSTAVVDPTTMTQTEVIEYGPVVTGPEVTALFEKIEYLAKGARAGGRRRLDLAARGGAAAAPRFAQDRRQGRQGRGRGSQRLEVAADDIVHLDAQDAGGRGIVDAHAAVVVHGHGRGLHVLQHSAGELFDDAPSLQAV